MTTHETRYGSVVAVGCAVLLCAVPWAMAGEVGAVRGIVLDTLGNPVAGAKARLGERSDKTRDDGVFFFDNLVLGAHAIVVMARGKSITRSVTLDRPRVYEISFLIGREDGHAREATRGSVIPLDGIVSHGTPAPRDGRIAVEIFASSTREGADVWIIDPNAEVAARFPNPEGSASNPRWSPDGQLIVYHNRLPRNRGNEIWLIDIAGRRTTKIAEGITPSFSPDGSTVVFSAKNAGNWDVYALHLGSAEMRRITDAPAHEIYPLWQRHGGDERIVFSAREESAGRAPDEYTYDLWQVAPDGSNRKRLTTVGHKHAGRAFGVSAPASGDCLTFWLWKKNAPPEVWRARSDGSHAQRLIENAANPEWGRQTNEQAVLYYTSDDGGREQLWRFETASR